MAQPPAALSRILDSLRADGQSDAPVSATADHIEMLADSELKALKKTEDGKKISRVVRDWYKKCESARASEVRIWYKNLDMYQGRQFTDWDDTLKRMSEPTGPSYEPRIAVNIIEPIVRTELAKTSSKKPTASIAPASNDQADIMAAEAAEQQWEWYYFQSRFQTDVFNDANFWRAICGNGYIKTFYDMTEIDEAATDAARRAAQDMAAQTAAESQQADLQGLGALMTPPAPIDVQPIYGKIRSESVPPFNIFVPDLTELRIQRQDYVIHAYTMSLAKAKMVYAKVVPDDWSPALVSPSSITPTLHVGVKGGNQAKPDSVEVLECWIKPNVHKQFPDGGLVITVADEIVAMSSDGMPYDHGEFPFAHLYSIETGRFYRKSVVQSVTPLQNELNRIYAQLIKAKNLMTKPQFFYRKGSVDPRRITSRAGQYIPVDFGSEFPQPVPMQGMPAYVMQLIADIRVYLDDISGQHQISRAQSPGAHTSASALALLQESDDSFLATTFDSIEAAVESVGRQELALVVQFWTEPRLVKVLGDERPFDAKMLRGADIKNGIDLRIDSQSGLPISKAGKIATITDWIDKKIISPEDGLDAMELGTLGKVYEKIKADKETARRENIEMRDADVGAISAWTAQQQQMQAQAAEQAAAAQQQDSAMQELQGIYNYQPPAAEPAAPTGALPAPVPTRQSGPNATTQPGAVAPALPGNQLVGAAAPAPLAPQKPIFYPINWYDNDTVHMAEHRLYANSQEYRLLDPAIQQVFEDHYYAHLKRSLDLQALANERNSSMAAQEAAEMAQQSPTTMMTARIGGKNAFAGEQFNQ
jgi:hypothetical protein